MKDLPGFFSWREVVRAYAYGASTHRRQVRVRQQLSLISEASLGMLGYRLLPECSIT
jgi:hypothetical protein